MGPVSSTILLNTVLSSIHSDSVPYWVRDAASAPTFSTPGIWTADNQMFLSIAQSQILRAIPLSVGFLPPWFWMYATLVVLSKFSLMWTLEQFAQKLCSVRKAAWSSLIFMCHSSSAADHGPPVVWPCMVPPHAKSELSLYNCMVGGPLLITLFTCPRCWIHQSKSSFISGVTFICAS